MLLINKQMFLFNQVGSCWDGEETQSSQRTCVEKVIGKLELTPDLVFDSVYVFNQRSINELDTTVIRLYISKELPLILKKESSINGTPTESEQIIGLEKN
jgi:hypothetical protein